VADGVEELVLELELELLEPVLVLELAVELLELAAELEVAVVGCGGGTASKYALCFPVAGRVPFY
jgi:hypothetical protein